MPDKITKFIKSLDKKTKARLKGVLEIVKSGEVDALTDVKKLKPPWPKSAFRVRMGKIRIVFVKDHNGVEIIDIDYRGNIY